MADDQPQEVATLPRKIPPAPRGLKTEGKRLWKQIWADYSLNKGECAILEAACRARDSIDMLQVELDSSPKMIPGSTGQMVAHPFISEIRAQEKQVADLIAKLALPDVTDKGSEAPKNQAREAVNSRWAKRGQSG